MFYNILWSLALLVTVTADLPVPMERELEFPSERSFTRNDEQIYRLPGDVVPLEYDIYIDLYFDERPDRPFSYDGREDIIVQAVTENVTQIVLHSNIDRINAVSVLNEDGAPVPLDLWNPFFTEPLYHFLRINLAETMTLGQNYTVFIDYTSTMNEGPMKRGIWRGWYTDDNNVERIYATTHFQPYSARQAFPCWDEPLYKAVYTLHLSKPSGFRNTFTNTYIGVSEAYTNDRVRDHFRPTPRMSSYLVTFLVSESFQVIAEDNSLEPPVRIIGRPNTAGLASRALQLVVGMTRFYDDYFQLPYASMHPYLHNDHVSSPDWASAGTENWGMVSYREMHMILDVSDTMMSVAHYTATLVSHEVVHMWFGNLITCYWWSNTWINEGFASYFGYIGTYEVFPEYEHLDHFNSRYLQSTLSFDSGTGTVPMNYDVNTPAQVTGHFGTISYQKGASFLRMTSDMITAETFRKACQYFLRENLFEPTNQYDLFSAFNQAVTEDGTLNEYLNFNFTQYYDVWVNQPGYPLLTVNVNHETGEMELSQERFFISASATPTGHIYPTPITYSTSGNRSFENLKPTYILTGERAVLQKDAGEEWVIFNHQQHGLYRVTYDNRTWDLIARALLEARTSIHHLNRAQIVDDVFALMRSTRMSYEQGFNILRFLRDEDNYHVWNPAISGYTWLRNRMRHLPEELEEFTSIILANMEHAIGRYGFDPLPGETPTETMTRQELLQFACNLGHQRCIEDSVTKFNALMNNEFVHALVRRHVYMTGIREGGRAEFEFLLRRLDSSNIANDQLEMLRGLAATRDPQLKMEYLLLTLTQRVRSHDKVTSFNYALTGNVVDNADTVLEFVRNNIDAIRVAYVEDAPPAPVNSALSNLATYLDEAGLVEYEDWLRTTQSNSLQFNGAISAINTARNNRVWGNNNAPLIVAAARDGATTVAVSAALLLATALLTRLV